VIAWGMGINANISLVAPISAKKIKNCRIPKLPYLFFRYLNIEIANIIKIRRNEIKVTTNAI
jgi:hypothetical protein